MKTTLWASLQGAPRLLAPGAKRASGTIFHALLTFRDKEDARMPRRASGL